MLPSWSPTIESVPSFIADKVLTSVLVPVRDGILPRATLFLRDSDGSFTDLSALRAANVDITLVVDESTSPVVAGVYARVYDDPENPFDLEAHGFPLIPRGDVSRCVYEHLCVQPDIDFAVIDRENRILLNRRLEVPERMRKAIARLAVLLNENDGTAVDQLEALRAVQAHQQKYAAKTVPY